MVRQGGGALEIDNFVRQCPAVSGSVQAADLVSGRRT